MSSSTALGTRKFHRLDAAVPDAPGCERARAQVEDHVGPPLPEPDVLDVRAGRARRAREMRVEDGELVTLVLQKPSLGIDLEIEAVRAGVPIPAGDIALRSEERRVGKECRARWAPYHIEKN